MWPSNHQSLDIETLLSRAGQLRKDAVFGKRQLIFSAGERSDSIYFIQGGTVKLTVISAEGREALLGIRQSGDFFGEEVVDTDGLQRRTNATALSDVRASKIDRRTILGLLRFDENLWEFFSASLLRLLSQVNKQLADNLLYASEQRLARVLVSLAHSPKSQPEDEYRRVASLSQQDLANMIGVSRQRTNYLMKRFSKLGFIDYAGGLRVHKSIRTITSKS